MQMFKSLVKRLKAAALTLQVFFAAAAFGLMVVSSYVFVGNIERRHLANESRNALYYVQAQVEHELREAAAMIDGVSQTVRDMALYGVSAENLRLYLADFSNAVLRHNVPGFAGVYCHLDNHGLIAIGGEAEKPEEGYTAEERPWYAAAMNANGGVAIANPFVDMRNAKGDTVIAVSRRVFGRDGEPLGIIAMELFFSSITEIFHNENIPDGCYIVLLDSSATLISHPSKEVIGQRLSQMKSGINIFEQDLVETGEIYEREIYNYNGARAVVFFRRIENGWYLGALTPTGIYYKSTRDMALFLSALGVFLAAILSFFLLRAQRAAIEKTREADERIQSMFDATPLGITLWDKNGGMVDCNMQAARVVGMRSKEEYLKRFAETAPEYQPNGKTSAEALSDALKTAFEEGSVRLPWEHKSLSGELIPFNVTSVRLRYKGGYVCVSYAQDMREFNAAVATTREAEERVQILLDSTPVSCTLFDENSVVLDCNLEAVKLVGASSKKEYMNNFLKFMPEVQPDGTPTSDKRVEFGEKALKEGYCRFEMAHQSKSGDILPCEVTLVRVAYKGSKVLAVYLRDLREQKAMIKEMHRAEIAEESNRAKSRFLAAMSHEIRTPMNVILGVTEIQLQDESLPLHLREAFVQIYNSSDLLLGIINDILDLSKIEADKMELLPALYELASLINDTAHLNMMRSSNPIEFELDVDENAPINLIGDELRIKQILNNMLSNAFKFTDAGKIKLIVKAEEESGESENVTLVLTVSDTGQGMTKEQMGRLFTEYTRFNSPANRMVEGTGLGMNITRRLVNMMGGSITVESEPDRGTTVCVRLPQKRGGNQRIGKELAENLRKFRVDTSSNAKKAHLTREYMPYGRALIVDDVESNLYVAKGLMAPYGLTIDTAVSGLEAVNKVKSGKSYDIIFMDHMMPKMDGIEAAKRIRELGYKEPIVALTANAVVGQADIFLKNGFDGFISKPIDIRQLNATLNKLVRDKQPAEVIEKARGEREAALRAVSASSANAASPELLAVFASDANRAMPIIEAAAKNAGSLPEGEMLAFTTAVHGMKSALANIGETRLSQMALSLEKAGKAGDKNAVAAHAQDFLKALRGIAAVAEVESKTKEAADKDEDPAFLKAQMAVISEACKAYDEQNAVKALDALKKMSWTAETEAAIENIGGLLLHSDFDEAAELAGTFYR
ncbi:MAG: response regulator [Chitinispirillales bacterium]|jgi:PAS domain S-box-containing protein|nr:response regulator [Chitinispirillales bacterium]